MKRKLLGFAAAAAALGSVATLASATLSPATSQAYVVARVCLAINDTSVGAYINDFTVGEEVEGNPRTCFKI